MRLSPTGYAATALAAISLGLSWPEAGAAARAVNGADFDQSLAAGATLLLLALSSWTLACIALSFATERAGAARRLARLITPQFARRALFLGAAGALAIGPAAAVNDGGGGSPGASVLSRSLDGLRLPDRPVAPATTAPAPARSHAIRVRPGDTLWSIASRHLGPGAGTAEIGASVEAWYDANKALIGADPDLIFPDLQLTPPAKESR